MGEVKIRLRTGVHQAKVTDGSILLDERNGTYYHLNETATRMLALLLHRNSEAVVAEELAGIYAVERHQVAHDLDELVRYLRDAGLVSA